MAACILRHSRRPGAWRRISPPTGLDPPLLKALAGGGRLSAAQIARAACEAGGPARLTGESYGEYIEAALIDGIAPELHLIQRCAGGEGKCSNHSVVAKGGHLTKLVRQMLKQSTTVLALDCGTTNPVEKITKRDIIARGAHGQYAGRRMVAPETLSIAPGHTVRAGDRLDAEDLAAIAIAPHAVLIEIETVPSEPITRWLEGAVLAADTELADGQRWNRGRILSPADVAEGEAQGANVQVRDPSRCETDNGLCARCVGSLRATGALPELGVIARFVRRITLRSLAASSAKRGVSWDSGSTDGRWRAPRPRSSSRSRRSTRYVPIPTARRAGAGSGPASITPDPVTACASFASTGSDAHSRSCSKPSTASKPTAFTWSASRSVSTPRRRPASSCSTSSAPSRTSSAGSSPSESATASPRPGNAVEHRVDRRSTRRRFRPLRNSSRPDCHPVKPPNSSE